MNLAQLEALTSSGLVRRARKALSLSEISWTSNSEEVRSFSFEGESGSLYISSIDRSRCSCPSPGLCKHIVAAAIALLEQAPGNTQKDFEPDLNDQSLFSHASKAAMRFANAQFDQYSPQLKKFPTHYELQWADNKAIIGKGEGLRAITVEIANEEKYQLLAGLLFLKAQQAQIIWPEWLAQERKTNDELENSTRLEFLAILQKELEDLARLGISNLKPAKLTTINTLAPKLKAAGLNIYTNRIRALDELVNRRISGEGFDPINEILTEIAALYALCQALQTKIVVEDPEEFDITLKCIGSHAWEALNGARGLNIIFMDMGGRIFSASIARSYTDKSFSIEQAQLQQIWPGVPNNFSILGKTLKLNRARLTPRGQLSQSQTVSAKLVKDANWNLYEFAIHDWSVLYDTPLYGYSLLEVSEWVACEFSESTQNLSLTLGDRNKNLLQISSHYSNITANRIANLLDTNGKDVKFLLVRHELKGGQNCFEPISIMTEDWFSLDFKKPEKIKLSIFQRITERFKSKAKELEVAPNELTKLFQNIEEALLHFPSIEDIRPYCSRLRELGLDLFANKLTNLGEDPEQYLQCVYILDLYLQHSCTWPISLAGKR